MFLNKQPNLIYVMSDVNSREHDNGKRAQVGACRGLIVYEITRVLKWSSREGASLSTPPPRQIPHPEHQFLVTIQPLSFSAFFPFNLFNLRCLEFVSISELQCELKKYPLKLIAIFSFLSWWSCVIEKNTLVIVQKYSYVYTNFGPII